MGRIRTARPAGARLLCASVTIALACSSAAHAAIHFEDVSAAAGITYVGRSWGSAWTDFDGDGYPDFWLVDHQNPPSLYRNQGDGTFVDIAAQVIEPGTQLVFDAHGAIWGDFDNDGDPDLYQLTDEGTTGPIPDRFFYNDNGILEDRAAQLGLDYPLGRGRMPLWLDYDRDGLLDVLHPTARHFDGSDGPTVLFHQETPGWFVDVSNEVGLPVGVYNEHFALLGDLTGDGTLELLTSENRFPENVFDMATVPFTDVKADIGLTTQCCVIDAVVADLDGDLDDDLFMVSGEQAEDFIQTDPDTVEAHLQGSSETGMELQSGGDVSVQLYPFWTVSDVYIGSAGVHPASVRPFTVSAADSTTWGIYPHVPGVDYGIYVGYDVGTSTWQILRTGTQANLVISSPAPLTAVAGVNWSPATETPNPDRYLVNLGSSFVDEAATSGFVIPSSARSVVAADFDDDMDLDLYVVSTGPVQNLPNILYENQGDGTFVVVPNAGGAAGNDLGRGECATVADYDRDGFPDLLVTNGTSKDPFCLDGPTFLFHNQGNSNHWIEIDLEGVSSNRDGVGCQLILTAGGVQQLREQNGGIHYRGQNHERVHFGLGPNLLADELRIRWPNGTVQVLENLPADHILRVTEPPPTGVLTEGGALTRDRPPVGSPNPFRSRTMVTFSLARSGPVTLSVHDAAGRLVRRLATARVFPAGANRVAWNGVDTAGRRVAAGVYLVRLQAGDFSATSKVVLLP